jgi:hypothetical protein
LARFHIVWKLKQNISYFIIFIHSFIHQWLYGLLLGPGLSLSLLQFSNHFYTDGRTSWTGDQSVARPLPTHRTTQTQNKHTDTHVLSGIRTHDPKVRANEYCSCIRPRDNCDRRYFIIHCLIYKQSIIYTT